MEEFISKWSNWWILTPKLKQLDNAFEKELNELIERHAPLRIQVVSSSLLTDVDYWKQRCLLAEKCLEESPCDPDITAEQIKAHNAYRKFISLDGNDR